MDESIVREHAETHAKATVAGDLKTAGSALTKEAMAQAPGVMKAMPATLESCEVTSVYTDGDEIVAQIRYAGGEQESTVESRWADHDGVPKITAMKVI
ncbi:MAG TPA: hypothetical protein VIG64_09195 [Actinomycetota bacterium]|jgi:hypothetical protein